MWHDEPANRQGQDPNAILPTSECEAHYRERISHYEELVKKFPAQEFFKTQLENYKAWLKSHLLQMPQTELDFPF